MAAYSYLDATGIIIPQTSDFLNEVETEYRDAIGVEDELIIDPETPEGGLITVETTARSSAVRNAALVANQLNPDFATNIFLDAHLGFIGTQRESALPSRVLAQVTGVPNTVLQVGSLAQTTEGDDFSSIEVIAIDGTGNGEGVFESIETGPIPIAANTLTIILDSVTGLGWETINNSSAGTLGQLKETDQKAKQRRKNFIAVQARSTALAVKSNLYAVTGVKSIKFRENITNATEVIDGITLVPHSVWTNVDGGTDQDVAFGLYNAKTGGANWNGAVSVDITDPDSDQDVTVQFDRPILIPVLARITVKSFNIATDLIESVKDTVIRYVNGEINGEEGFVIGAEVSPFEIAGAIGQDSPTIFVTRIEVSYATTPPVYVTDTLPITIAEKATLDRSDIDVIVVNA